MSWGWQTGQYLLPSVSLQSYTFQRMKKGKKSHLLFIPNDTLFTTCVWFYVGLHDDITQEWRRRRSVVKHGGETDDFLCEVELYVAWPLGVHFDQLHRAVSRFDKLDGDASAGRSLLLWNCLADGLHLVTVCYFVWKSEPYIPSLCLLLLIRGHVALWAASKS